jgi:Sec-independent protein translocase protein TatA
MLSPTPRKLPELARGVGESMKELKQTLHGEPEPEPDATPASAAPLPEGDR